MKKLRITLTRSCIGRPEKQRRVVAGLGLRRMHHTVVRDDTPEIRGMVNKVKHLLRVDEVEGEDSTED